MRGVTPAESSTILSPPVGSYDPNNGHIAVKVLGSDATPLGGVPVTVTASGFNRNLTTTSDGCAFFAFVPPASYTVTPRRGRLRRSPGQPQPVAGHRRHLGRDQLGRVRLRPGCGADPDDGLDGRRLVPVQPLGRGRQQRVGAHRARRSSPGPGRSGPSGTCTRTRTATKPGPGAARTPTLRARTATASRSGRGPAATPGSTPSRAARPPDR